MPCLIRGNFVFAHGVCRAGWLMEMPVSTAWDVGFDGKSELFVRSECMLL